MNTQYPKFRLALRVLGITVVMLALSFSSLHAQKPFSFDENYGVVQRLYVDQHRAFFKLAGGKTAMTQQYYFVPRTHANYDSLVRLLYLAAEKRWTLKVRTTEQLTVDKNAEVIYFVVDF